MNRSFNCATLCRTASVTFAAAFLANSGIADPVMLQSDDGTVRIEGDIVSFNGKEYVLDVPNVGEMRVMASLVTCAGADCPDENAEAVESPTQITLTPNDGSEAITGTYENFEKGIFIVRTADGLIPVPADDVTCSGPGCPNITVSVSATSEPQETDEAPTAERLVPDVIMAGSDNVGEDLLPLTMESFAEMWDATVTGPVEFPDNIAQFVFTPNGGGDPFVIEIESNDSELGIDRVVAGTADIAMSSRDAERYQINAMLQQGRGNLLDISQEYIIGVDAIVMITHADNPVNVLSRRQLAAMYTGEITNWSEVGGPDMPVTIVARPGGSARRNFEAWALEGNERLTSDAVIIDGGKALTREVMATPGSLGYSISDNVLESKPINLVLDCGVRTDASPFKSKAEEYLMGRRIRLYIGSQNPKPEVQQIVDFMVSPEADDEVDESGYYSLGLVTDPTGLERLMDAALIGQPSSVGRSVQGDVMNSLSGADRVSLTFRFPTGEFELDSKALRDLDRLVEYMSRPENAGREFIFAGYADTVGQYAYNTQLSRNRANQVLQRLRSHPNAFALRNTQISTVGLSEAAPVSCNDTQYGRSRNRRVEVWVR